MPLCRFTIDREFTPASFWLHLAVAEGCEGWGSCGISFLQDSIFNIVPLGVSFHIPANRTNTQAVHIDLRRLCE